MKPVSVSLCIGHYTCVLVGMNSTNKKTQQQHLYLLEFKAPDKRLHMFIKKHGADPTIIAHIEELKGLTDKTNSMTKA